MKGNQNNIVVDKPNKISSSLTKKRLKKAGLNDLEIQIFMYLLDHGPSFAKDMDSIIGKLDSMYKYRWIYTLKKKRIIKFGNSIPRKMSPLPLEKAISILNQRKKKLQLSTKQ